MKKKLSSIALVSLSVLMSCSTAIVNTKNPTTNAFLENKIRTSVVGKAEFPRNFSTKATLAEVGVNATVSIIYPSDHSTLANKTIATGLTDANGNFVINPDASFNPSNNDIFVLEAIKRIGSSGKSLISVRTNLKWNGTSWSSITTPSININIKTTALSAMAGLLTPNVSSDDTIGTITVSGNTSTPTDIKHLGIGPVIIKATSITAVSNLFLDYSMSKDQDPLQYLKYENGAFTMKDPLPISNIITTVAGGSNAFTNFDNYHISNIPLSSTMHTSFDSIGNMYIPNYASHKILKVSTSGIITTIAGNGTAGFSGDGGPATNASLNYPNAVKVSSTGEIYISDLSNNRVRKIDTNGIITTFAGTGQNFPTTNNTQATATNIGDLGEIAFDSTGNVYIAEGYNQTIRKVDKTTGIMTFYPNTTASFSVPRGLTTDSTGNFYVSEAGSGNKVKKINKTTGVITIIAGAGNGYSGDGGQATAANIFRPRGIVIDSLGNTYIADTFNNRIRKISTTGIITTVAGNGTAGFSGDGGQATAASINAPEALSIDSSDNLYISDTSNNRIRKVDKTTGIISTFSGAGVGDGGQATFANILYGVQGVALDSLGNFYIADSYHQRIRKVDKTTGIITTIAGTGTSGFSGDGGLATDAMLGSSVKGVGFDSSDNMYIVDSVNSRIRKVDKITGIITTIAGTGTSGFSGDGGLATAANINPTSLGVQFDSLGNMYFADFTRIRKVDKITGIITTIAGNGTQSYSGDGGLATAANINNVNDLAIDISDNIYFSDTNNQRIRKINASTAIITTIAGNGVYGYSGDNSLATAAQFSNPSGITIDSLGNIYVADTNNQRIRKINANTGIITTVIGNGVSGSSGDNKDAFDASISTPYGLRFDSNGSLYIGEVKVRKVTAVTQNIIP